MISLMQWRGWQKYIAPSLVLLLVSQLLLGDDAALKPVKILDARESAYLAAPAISLPLNREEPIQYYTMTLVPNEELGRGAFKQRNFSPALIEPGDVLEINAYLVADRIADAANNVEKGPDAPLFSQLKDAFNDKDSDVFLKLLKKLAEQRRGAKTLSQLKEMARGFGQDPSNPLTIDFYSMNDYLYGTGYVEVSSKKLKQANPELLYYVPLEFVQEGKVKIDLAQAKMEVLQGITYFAFSLTQGSEQFAKSKELIPLYDMAQSCSALACSVTDGLDLGTVMGDIYSVLRLGRDLEFFPQSEARLNYRKQLCVLQRFFSICKAATEQLSRIEQLIIEEKIKCKELRSILKGMKIKSEK